MCVRSWSQTRTEGARQDEHVDVTPRTNGVLFVLIHSAALLVLISNAAQQRATSADAA